MGIKSEKLIIRITEQQAKFLADMVIQEQRTRSEITRQALNQLIIEKANKFKDKQTRNGETKK
jgi:metal-responsive CopG/Arc/MetJ family transcriptional regulator